MAQDVALIYSALGNETSHSKSFEKKFYRTLTNSIMICCQDITDLRDDPRFADLVRRLEFAKMG